MGIYGTPDMLFHYVMMPIAILNQRLIFTYPFCAVTYVESRALPAVSASISMPPVLALVMVSAHSIANYVWSLNIQRTHSKSACNAAL